MSTTVAILCFYWHNQSYNYNQCLKSLDTDVFLVLHFTNHINFQSLEVVDRGSETQLEVTEKLY